MIVRSIRGTLLRLGISAFTKFSGVAQLVKVRPRHNQYEKLKKEQLLELADSAELSINEMILLSSSLSAYGVRLPKLYSLIAKHVRTTDRVLLGTFLSSYFSADHLPNEFMVFYIDWFSGDAGQELIMAELLHRRKCKFQDETEQYLHHRALEVNKERMLNLFRLRSLDFSELLQFMRYYRTEATAEQLRSQLVATYQGRLGNDQAILFRYLTQGMDTGVDVQLPEWSNDPKSICMLLQLTVSDPVKHQQLLQRFQHEDLKNWQYDSVVWGSEFLSEQQLERLHNHLLVCCSLDNIRTFMIYARRLPLHLAHSLCQWTINQEQHLYRTFEVDDLLDLLNYLPEEPFAPYLEMLMKESRCKFTWEQVNQLYYFAKKWQLESEHTESLRIYVVTGYNSLGVNRRMIPTSSYYYRIIEIVPPEELYKFKVNFGDAPVKSN